MRNLIIILLCLGTNFALHAQSDPIFTVVMPDTVPPDTRFEVSFVLKNGSGDNFEPPSFVGFKVLSGPNVSSSYSFINGKSSQEMSYNYILQAESTGTKTIDQAKIYIDNKAYKTTWAKIAVVEGYVMPRQKDPFNDFFNRRDFFEMPGTMPHDDGIEKPIKKKKSKKKTYRI